MCLVLDQYGYLNLGETDCDLYALTPAQYADVLAALESQSLGVAEVLQNLAAIDPSIVAQIVGYSMVFFIMGFSAKLVYSIMRRA